MNSHLPVQPHVLQVQAMSAAEVAYLSVLPLWWAVSLSACCMLQENCCSVQRQGAFSLSASLMCVERPLNCLLRAERPHPPPAACLEAAQLPAAGSGGSGEARRAARATAAATAVAGD